MKLNSFVVTAVFCMFAQFASADCENDCSIDFTNAIDSCCTEVEGCQSDDPLHYNECSRGYAHCTQAADRGYAKCLASCQ